MGKKGASFWKLWDSVELYANPSDGDVARFMSQMRPHAGNPESHYTLARYLQQRARHDEAAREFKKAIYIKPDFVEAYNGLGVSYDWQGDYVAAARAYSMAIELKPDAAYLHNNLGHSYMLQEDYASAVEAFKKALELAKTSKRIRNNLGLAYGMMGEYTLAMREFMLTDSKDKAHYYMARVFQEQGKHEEAKRQYNLALALNPESELYRKGLESSAASSRYTVLAQRLSQAIEVILPGNATNGQPVPVKDASVEISNGNGAGRMATIIGRYLKEKGFNVVRLTNADNFNHRRTQIYHKKEYAAASRQLADQLPEMPSIEEVSRLERENVKVRMILGKDLVAHRDEFAKEIKP
jgi:tetratricopeptide (TPR) repeat protein